MESPSTTPSTPMAKTLTTRRDKPSTAAAPTLTVIQGEVSTCFSVCIGLRDKFPRALQNPTTPAGKRSSSGADPGFW